MLGLWILVLAVLPQGASSVEPRSRELVRREISSAADISPPRKRAPPPGPSRTCEDFVSHYECKGTRGYDQSCIFHCAYLTPDAEGRWVVTLLVENSSNLTDVAISDWDMPAIRVENPVTVKLQRFASREALQDYARAWISSHQRGLSVLFRTLWQDRWAHALFDGLYPVYVSLARFGLAHHAFTPVVLLSNYTSGLDCRIKESQFMGLSGAGIYTGTACQMEEALRLFGAASAQVEETSQSETPRAAGAALLRINDLRDQLHRSAMLFDHLVSGSAHLGEYASVLALPGTAEASLVPTADLLGDFTDRMYAAHGVPAPRRQAKTKRLKALITANKRMSPEDVADLMQLAEVSSLRETLDIKFVDWSTVQPFRAQLEMLRETDILVSGIGTALFYSAFLPLGSVCINTGWKDDASVPTYGEDILGFSNHRTRFLYMPLEKVRRGVTPGDIDAELRRAAALLERGNAPFRPEENLSIFGRIILELGTLSPASRQGLQGRGPDGGFLCHQRPTGQTSLSDLVFERNLDAKNLLFELEPMTLAEACQLDLHMLRQLKHKYNLTKALGLEPEPNCECVACEHCGFTT